MANLTLAINCLQSGVKHIALSRSLSKSLFAFSIHSDNALNNASSTKHIEPFSQAVKICYLAHFTD
jgi:hypothetical protein